MAEVSQDLTVVWYTAGELSPKFAHAMLDQLLEAKGDLPMVTIAKPKDVTRGHLQIYRQALEGAKIAKTKYIALCEDDVLYSSEHFKHRPSPGKFAYNMNAWNIFTWQPDMFTQKLGGRKNLNGLICERDLFIEAMEERFTKYPDDSKVNLSLWAEPGKYERQLGVTVREFEHFTTNPPNIIFSHENALSFENLGTKKRVGEIRATEIPYWGKAENIAKMYKEK